LFTKRLPYCDTYYSEDFQNFFAKILFNQRESRISRNIARILIKNGNGWTMRVSKNINREMKVHWFGKYFEDIFVLKIWISLPHVRTASNCVRTQITESLCLLHFWTAHQTQVIERSCPLHVWTAQQTQVSESPCLQDVRTHKWRLWT